MLRLILALALIIVAAGLGYWFGHNSDRNPMPIAAAQTEPDTTGDPRAADAESRSRTDVMRPHIQEPPPDVAVPLNPPVPPTLPQDRMPPATEEERKEAAPLLNRKLSAPLSNLKMSDIQDTFYQSRGGGERRHEATDIMAPRGTPVLAMDDGTIEKLFDSKPGGLTIYLFDSAGQYCFYYAHLDRYAEGIREGMFVTRGSVIGYVGSTGNADINAPHLHLAIMELGAKKKWWEGNKPINPHAVLMALLKR